MFHTDDKEQSSLCFVNMFHTDNKEQESDFYFIVAFLKLSTDFLFLYHVEDISLFFGH